MMSSEEAPAVAAGETKEEQRKASQSSHESEPSGERTRTVSSGSGGYDDTAPKRRQRSFSASEGRTIVIAVDASDDAKFAFECEYLRWACVGHKR